LETEEIGHGPDGEIGHEVHALRVDEVDERLPLLDGAIMRVKDGEVERGVT
jgi:uncharacterized small protein (DUF1192 family)